MFEQYQQIDSSVKVTSDTPSGRYSCSHSCDLVIFFSHLKMWFFFQNIPLTELTADSVHQHLNISGSEPKSSSAFCFYLPHGWVTWWSVHFHFLLFSCRRRRHDTVTQRRLFVLDDSSPSPPPGGGCGADGSQNPQNPQNNRPNHRPVSAKEKKSESF